MTKKNNKKNNGKNNIYSEENLPLFAQYEDETGKKAVWKNKITAGFKAWKEERESEVSEVEDMKVAIEEVKETEDVAETEDVEIPKEDEFDNFDDELDLDDEEEEVKTEPKKVKAKPKKVKVKPKPKAKAEPKPKLSKEEVLELEAEELFILHDKKYWISTTFFAILNESVVQSINSKYRNNKEELESHSVLLKIGNDRKKRYFDMYAVEFISETLKINCYDLVSDKIPKK